MKIRLISAILFCMACKGVWGQIEGPDKQVFSNPVISKRLPDPTAIRAKDKWYYLYATEDTRNVPIWKSRNMIDWTFVGTAFTDTSRPSFLPKGGIWAPEINYIQGKYVLYYSMSTWGGHWTAGIGAAISDNPEGPFADQGKIFDSKSIEVENSIDQTYFDDGKKKYMLWGSFHGIYAIELTKNGLAVKKGTDKVKIAGTAYEGAYIYKKGKYYYFFGSTGSCCEGLNSTYQLVYGRSRSLLGPYVNKRGGLLINNNHDVLIGKNEGFVGNGHNAQILKDDDSNDWLFYHGFVNEDNSKKLDRYLLLSQLKWDQEGWPYVDGNSPKKTAKAPFIR